MLGYPHIAVKITYLTACFQQENHHSGWRLSDEIPFSIVMLSSVCSFIRLPKAEGEDCTLGGSKERDVDRCVTARHHPPPTDSGLHSVSASR